MESEHSPQQSGLQDQDVQHISHPKHLEYTTEEMDDGSEMRSETPPAAVEPEVPNPFIVDDGEDEDEEEGEEGNCELAVEVGVEDENRTPTAEDEIALAQSIILDPLTLNVDKPVPLPPIQQVQDEVQAAAAAAIEVSGLAYDDDDDDEEEEEDDEPPELYLPGLVLPTMFLPIPNTDPLASLLTKYIPPERRPARDVSGDWQHADFHTLVMTNSWRALARMARDRIVSCNPGDVGLILELWSLRLSSLARLRLFNQTSAELSNLYSVLTSNSIPSELPTPLPNAKQGGVSPRDYLWQTLVPFELEVLHAKTRYWAGDHMGYVDELTDLITRCKRKAREAIRVSVSDIKGTTAKGGEGASEKVKAREERRKERERAKEKEKEREKEMWKERGARVCLILASQLIEMKEYTAAARLLLPLARQPSPPSSDSQEKIPSPHILAAIGRIYLQAGDLAKASTYFTQVASYHNQTPEPRDETLDSLVCTNSGLLACAEGRWEDAERIFVDLVRREGDSFAATNNLAVALLSQGRLKEGIYVLERALSQSPAILCATEPFLFNLSTLYELRSNTAADKKRELLVEVAKWAGDGLRTTCLKMPT